MPIKLNVGGHVYWTTKDTLTGRSTSMLSAMVVHSNPAQLVDGAYFIDRDPEIFRWLLLYLRGSNVLPRKDSPELWLIKEEAEYFAMDGLSARIHHILCPSFKKTDNVMIRSLKFTILDVQTKGYLVTRQGQNFKIDSSETVEPTTLEVGDIVMAWYQAINRRKKGIVTMVEKKICAIQFDQEETSITCPRSGIRF